MSFVPGSMDSTVRLWDATKAFDDVETDDFTAATGHIHLPDNSQELLLGTYHTKSTPVTHLHFTRRNLLLAAGAYNSQWRDRIFRRTMTSCSCVFFINGVCYLKITTHPYMWNRFKRSERTSQALSIPGNSDQYLFHLLILDLTPYALPLCIKCLKMTWLVSFRQFKLFHSNSESGSWSLQCDAYECCCQFLYKLLY